MTRSEAGKLGYLASKGSIDKLRIETALKYDQSPKCCKRCSEKLPYSKRQNNFCNSRCMAFFHNKKVMIDCVGCGTPTLKWKNKGQKLSKYCSRDCYLTYVSKVSLEKRKEYVRKWQSGEIVCDSGTLHDAIRDYILNKFNHKCSQCGWCEINIKMGKPPLTVHHIDGNPYNSIESNLDLLCPNCHSLTHSYGGLNRGKGRGYRYGNEKPKGAC